MNVIFPSNFYFHFQAPNYKELTFFLNKENNIDNSKFTWGSRCEVDKISLKWENYIELIQPSIDIFANFLQTPINYKMYNPWLNLYKRGYFQEVHDHRTCDFSCVFFLNNEENFSKFYFIDRNASSYSSRWIKIIDKLDDTWTIDINPGDILFFPGHMLHGVTKHNSDNIRKTFSCNFDFIV